MLTPECKLLMDRAVEMVPSALSAPPEERWVYLLSCLDEVVLEAALIGAWAWDVQPTHAWVPVAELVVGMGRALLYGAAAEEHQVEMDRAMMDRGMEAALLAIAAELCQRSGAFESIAIPPDPWGNDWALLGLSAPSLPEIERLDCEVLRKIAKLFVRHWAREEARRG